MMPLRAPVALACLLALLAAVPLAANPVLVARAELSGADATSAARLDASLREEARHVLGDRLLAVSPARPEGCSSDGACAATLATTHGASAVVFTSYTGKGGKSELRVRLHDASGSLLGAVERSLSGALDGRVLRGALTELLSPSSYVGRLRVRNAPSDAQVKVDHLPLSAAERLQPYALSVGTHLVEVSTPEGAPLVREVSIAFDEELVFDATLPEGGATAPASALAVAPVPWWPAAVSGTVSAIATTVAAVAAIDWAHTYGRVATLDADLRPEGDNFNAHLHVAMTIPENAEAAQLPLERAAIRTDMLIVGVAGSIALVSAVATGALAARWALAEEPAEEAP